MYSDELYYYVGIPTPPAHSAYGISKFFVDNELSDFSDFVKNYNAELVRGNSSGGFAIRLPIGNMSKGIMEKLEQGISFQAILVEDQDLLTQEINTTSIYLAEIEQQRVDQLQEVLKIFGINISSEKGSALVDLRQHLGYYLGGISGVNFNEWIDSQTIEDETNLYPTYLARIYSNVVTEELTEQEKLFKAMYLAVQKYKVNTDTGVVKYLVTCKEAAAISKIVANFLTGGKNYYSTECITKSKIGGYGGLHQVAYDISSQTVIDITPSLLPEYNILVEQGIAKSMKSQSWLLKRVIKLSEVKDFLKFMLNLKFNRSQ